jgi:protein ImuA
MLEQSDKSAVIVGLSEKIRALESAQQTIGPSRLHNFRFAVPAIDEALASVQFPFPGHHEIHGKETEADFAVANAFVAFIASKLSGGVLWCVGKSQLYAPAISALGLSANKIHFFYARSDEVALAAMEEGLRYSSLGAVVGEVKRLSLNSSRRLILASEKSGVPAFTLRPPIAKRKHEQVACGSRWQLSSAPAGPLPVAGVGRSRWRVELLRCRGNRLGEWLVEANASAGHFNLSAAMASRNEAAQARARQQTA